MKPRYRITPQGIQYAIASEQSDDKRRLLFFILKRATGDSTDFNEISTFYNNDKKCAFKKICALLDLQLIMLDEADTNPGRQSDTKPLLSEEFVLSDVNGLTIDYRGFDSESAQQISANASDFLRISHRHRHRQTMPSTPLCIETTWQDKSIKIYQLYLENFTCLLTSKTHSILKHPTFIPHISYLCKRYNYAQP